MNTKKLTDLADRLEKLNLWRRGDSEVTLPPPYEIGQDIDQAVSAIRDYADSLTAKKREIHHD